MIIVLFIVALMTPIGKLIILNIIEPSDHEYDLVTTEKEYFKDNKGNIIGELPSGVVLHEPCRHDLDFTDPGDPRIWKLYIEPVGNETTKLKNSVSESLNKYSKLRISK